ncbi:C-type lectin domain family 4 member D-like [Mytilus trossulus]|uniref:C-type lectin domain family 4 member D-like n=1 Tax=Mytilus trossulus TaxID=6551 RepID=UPI003004B086
MINFCCSIVIILCTLDVSHGGILSGKCRSSNGTCGQRGYSCDATFGEGWNQFGKCCNERPCCKSQCVPETCPKRFTLLPNQSDSTNCYFDSGENRLEDDKQWEHALLNCTETPGAYLWRPNTIEETEAVNKEFNLKGRNVWTGARDYNSDGNFRFAIENSSLVSLKAVPFGIASENLAADSDCVIIYFFGRPINSWIWADYPCRSLIRYICEYPRKVCP